MDCFFDNFLLPTVLDFSLKRSGISQQSWSLLKELSDAARRVKWRRLILKRLWMARTARGGLDRSQRRWVLELSCLQVSKRHSSLAIFDCICVLDLRWSCLYHARNSAHLGFRSNFRSYGSVPLRIVQLFPWQKQTKARRLSDWFHYTLCIHSR
jgi:hypothetical protein